MKCSVCEKAIKESMEKYKNTKIFCKRCYKNAKNGIYERKKSNQKYYIEWAFGNRKKK